MPTFHGNPKALLVTLAALLSAAPVAGQAQKDKTPLVAVLETAGGADVAPMSKGTVQHTLELIIFNSGKYRVTKKERTDYVTKNHGFISNGTADNGRAREVGRLLQADYACVSSLRKDGDYFTLACSLIDVQSGRTFASATEPIVSERPAEVQASAERAARTLLGAAGAPAGTPARGTWGAPAEDRPQPPPRRAAPADSDEIREAKATINRLMPHFSFSRDGGGVTCTSNLLVQWEEGQRRFYSNRSNWQDAGMKSWAHFWWHSLFVEIRSGRLEALSRYTFADGANTKEALNHTSLAVTTGGKTISVPLIPAPPRPAAAKGGAAATFSGSEGMAEQAVQTEEGAIPGEDIPRAIAAAGPGPVRVELKGNRTKAFDLSQSVQEGIAQTVALYDAIRVLEAAGVEIQKSYAQ